MQEEQRLPQQGLGFFQPLGSWTPRALGAELVHTPPRTGVWQHLDLSQVPQQCQAGHSLPPCIRGSTSELSISLPSLKTTCGCRAGSSEGITPQMAGDP